MRIVGSDQAGWDVENAVTDAKDGLGGELVGQPGARGEHVLIQGNIGAARIFRSADQRESALERKIDSRGKGAVGIGQKEAEAIVALRPGARQIVAETQVQSEFAGDPPVVLEIKRAVDLLAGGRHGCS